MHTLHTCRPNPCPCFAQDRQENCRAPTQIQKVGPIYTIDCVRGFWGHAPGNVEILHAMKSSAHQEPRVKWPCCPPCHRHCSYWSRRIEAWYFNMLTSLYSNKLTRLIESTNILLYQRAPHLQVSSFVQVHERVLSYTHIFPPPLHFCSKSKCIGTAMASTQAHLNSTVH